MLLANVAKANIAEKAMAIMAWRKRIARVSAISQKSAGGENNQRRKIA
jgi:hypothetical protein